MRGRTSGRGAIRQRVGPAAPASARASQPRGTGVHRNPVPAAAARELLPAPARCTAARGAMGGLTAGSVGCAGRGSPGGLSALSSGRRGAGRAVRRISTGVRPAGRSAGRSRRARRPVRTGAAVDTGWTAAADADTAAVDRPPRRGWQRSAAGFRVLDGVRPRAGGRGVPAGWRRTRPGRGRRAPPYAPSARAGRASTTASDDQQEPAEGADPDLRHRRPFRRGWTLNPIVSTRDMQACRHSVCNRPVNAESSTRNDQFRSLRRPPERRRLPGAPVLRTVHPTALSPLMAGIGPVAAHPRPTARRRIPPGAHFIA